MKLNEAIEEMEKEIPPIPANEWSYNTQAKALGIEALKWRAMMEKDYGSWCGPLLPGETEPQDDPLHSRYYKRPIKSKAVSK